MVMTGDWFEDKWTEWSTRT